MQCVALNLPSPLFTQRLHCTDPGAITARVSYTETFKVTHRQVPLGLVISV